MKRISPMIAAIIAAAMLTLGGCSKHDISSSNASSVAPTPDSSLVSESSSQTAPPDSSSSSQAPIPIVPPPIVIPEDSAYNMLNAYVDIINRVRVDLDKLQTCDDYDLFRQYFFGEWESGEGYLRSNILLDDSENINLAGWGHFGEFYKVSDSVLAFTVVNNAESFMLWLDINAPDKMYVHGITSMNGGAYVFSEGKVEDPHILAKTAAQPSEPQDGYLSIFKLHEMAKTLGVDLKTLTDFDIGEVDGVKMYHDATYAFLPMYLVSEEEGKLVIKSSVANMGTEPIEVLCTYEKSDGAWNCAVERV